MLKLLQTKIKLIALLVVLSSMTRSASCLAEELPTSTKPPAPESSNDQIMKLTDEFQSSLSGQIIDLSNSIDELFGTERLDEEASQSRGRIRVGAEINEGRGFDLRQGVNLSLDLPRIAERLQLVLSSTVEGQDISPIGDGIQVPTQNDIYSSGLRYFLFSEGPTRVNLDGGFRWNGRPSPFLQLRLRYIFAYDDWVITPTQFLFWREKNGRFGETSRLYLDRQLSDQTLLRLRSEATLSQDSDGLEYSQSATTYSQEDQKIGYSFSGLIRGATGQDKGVELCQVSALYRQQLNREWLFLQFGPVATFEEDRDWRFAPGAIIQLEVFVGEISDPIRLW